MGCIVGGDLKRSEDKSASVEPIAVEKSHICGNYQYFVKLIRRLGTDQGTM